jgi:HD-like signal output (HDOD) protein
MSNLDAFFSAVKLPSMSEVAHELIQTLNDEDVAVSRVRDIIAKDPALTAKLLRLANSAQFGLQRGVATLDDAISLVGMAKVRTMSLSSCMNDSFPALPGLDRQTFWRTSMHCAGYAQWLAGGLGMDGQTAWLTGMMLRLGELLIGQADRRWNFPDPIVVALQRSSDPLTGQGFSKLAAIVHLAGLLADASEPGEKAVETLPPDVMKALLLDVQWMHKRFPAPDTFIDVTAS